ncbi:MAG: hypothetical protein AABX51_04660 [Nanoarchaeota archaeon]
MLPDWQSLDLETILLVVQDVDLRWRIVSQLYELGAAIDPENDPYEAEKLLQQGNYTRLIYDSISGTNALKKAARNKGVKEFYLVDSSDDSVPILIALTKNRSLGILLYTSNLDSPIDDLTPIGRNLSRREDYQRR